MRELFVLGVVVVALMVAVTAAARLIGPLIKRIEYVLLAGSVLIILFVMSFVGAEVVMRYVFNAPIPGHLEGSELLVPAIVFLALSYTQATHGHVGMDLVLDVLSPVARRNAMIGTLLLSIFVCAVLAYFSFKNAYQLWLYDDVTMTPPYFRTWPAAATIPIGYGLIALRMYLQILNIYDPERFPENAPARGGLHGGE